jgi:ATP-binding cassette subfamily B protein
MIEFVQVSQDAKISLERLSEIHQNKDEEDQKGKLMELPSDSDILITDLVFQYEGPHSPKVLDGINLKLSRGKVTAIVGSSGSGKTTLVKLLLGFYPPVSGGIQVGSSDLSAYSQHWWRGCCGAVMQDGFIFSDSIAANIAVGDEAIDINRLNYAVQMANVKSFIETLPLAYNTIIGAEGIGLSQGQKQRILIARAIYKNPEFIFLDEATNALDSGNEKVILENMKAGFGLAFAGNPGFDQLRYPVNVVCFYPQLCFDDAAGAFRPGLGPEKSDFQGQRFGIDSIFFHDFDDMQGK